jgi:hypothetical protein
VLKKQAEMIKDALLMGKDECLMRKNEPRDVKDVMPDEKRRGRRGKMSGNIQH